MGAELLLIEVLHEVNRNLFGRRNWEWLEFWKKNIEFELRNVFKISF